jgi:hypothetical protein
MKASVFFFHLNTKWLLAFWQLISDRRRTDADMSQQCITAWSISGHYILRILCTSWKWHGIDGVVSLFYIALDFSFLWSLRRCRESATWVMVRADLHMNWTSGSGPEPYSRHSVFLHDGREVNTWRGRERTVWRQETSTEQKGRGYHKLQIKTIQVIEVSLQVMFHSLRFQVLKGTRMKMTVFWDVAPCSLVEVYRRFRGAYCLHHQSDRPPSLKLR